MTRKGILILTISFIAVLGVVLLIVFLAQRQGGKATNDVNTPEVTIKTDPDTGEQITSDPALSQHETTDASPITILGLADMIDSEQLSTQQSTFVRDQLTQFGTTNLAGKYNTLTIRPQDTTKSGDIITSTVRFGDTNTTVNLRFESGTDTGKMQLFITDPTGSNGGNYTSPVEALVSQ